MLLDQHRTALVLIDVQEKLTAVMHQKDALLRSLQKIIQAAVVLDIPIIWNEQNPSRMGPTVESLRSILKPAEPLEKMCFGCCDNAACMEALRQTQRDQILVAGIESHVCVLQTVSQLMAKGYEVQVLADAISSRNPFDQEIAQQKIAHICRNQALPPLTTVEAALFEMMRTAEHPNFKDILKIIR